VTAAKSIIPCLRLLAAAMRAFRARPRPPPPLQDDNSAGRVTQRGKLQQEKAAYPPSIGQPLLLRNNAIRRSATQKSPRTDSRKISHSRRIPPRSSCFPDIPSTLPAESYLPLLFPIRFPGRGKSACDGNRIDQQLDSVQSANRD